MSEPKAFVTANQIVHRHRLSYQTLNYYTNLGLLHVVKRHGTERLYNAQDVERQLQAVGRLKDEGYPLRLISRLLNHHEASVWSPAAAVVRRAA